MNWLWAHIQLRTFLYLPSFNCEDKIRFVIFHLPVSVAERFHWNRRFESCFGHGCVSQCFYVVLSCVGRGLASGWSPGQGVLPSVSICRSRKPIRVGQRSAKDCKCLFQKKLIHFINNASVVDAEPCRYTLLKTGRKMFMVDNILIRNSVTDVLDDKRTDWRTV
jgi:hypothetical protein